MVNPPRDEIRKIRAQLQEYGQVGDANVFYWFQNRKSRSKHKLRQLQNSKNHQNPPPAEPQQNTLSLPQTTAPSSSSSSSEKSSTKEITPTKVFSIGFTSVSDVVPNSPTASVNQTYFHTTNETTLPAPPPPPATEAFFFPVQHHAAQGHGVILPNNTIASQGFCFSELTSVVQSQPHVGPSTSLLLSEIMNRGASSEKGQDQYQDYKSVKTMHPYSQLSFCVTPTTTVHTATVVPPITTTTITVPSPIITAQVHGNN